MRWLRRACLKKSLRLLEQMSPVTGGYLEAIAPRARFVVMSLASIGQIEHPAPRRGVEFLLTSGAADGPWLVLTRPFPRTTAHTPSATTCGMMGRGDCRGPSSRQPADLPPACPRLHLPTDSPRPPIWPCRVPGSYDEQHPPSSRDAPGVIGQGPAHDLDLETLVRLFYAEPSC